MTEILKKNDYPSVYLKASELCVCRKPTVVKTVLGSCVAVTMFCARRKIGMMCHAMMPHPGIRDSEDSHDPAIQFKYVSRVIPEMVRRMSSYGIKQNEIEVKLFGGAGMKIFSALSAGSSFATPCSNGSFAIGKSNVKIAKQLIETKNLRLIAEDVGGSLGRKIIFHSDTGRVLLKRINSKNTITHAVNEPGHLFPEPVNRLRLCSTLKSWP